MRSHILLDGIIVSIMRILLMIIFLFSFLQSEGQMGYVKLEDFGVNGITYHRRIWIDSQFVYLAGTMSEIGKYPGIYTAKFNFSGELKGYNPIISSDTVNHVLNNSSSEGWPDTYRLGTRIDGLNANTKFVVYRHINYYNYNALFTYNSKYFSDSIDLPKQTIYPGGIDFSGKSLFASSSESCPKNIGANIVRIVNIDTSGSIIWTKEFTRPDAVGTPMQLKCDNNGGAYVGIVWNEEYIEDIKIEKDQYIEIVHLDHMGNKIESIFTPRDKAKYFNDPIDSLWYGPTDFIQTDNGDFIISSARGREIYMPYRKVWIPSVLKLSSLGQIVWNLDFENEASIDARLNRIKKSADNENYVVVGISYDTLAGKPRHKGIFACFSPNGDEIFRRYYSNLDSDSAYDELIDVVVSENGGYYLVGSCVDNKNPSTLKKKGWMIKVDSLGCIMPECDLNTYIEEFEPDVEIYRLYPNPISLNHPIINVQLHGEIIKQVLVFDVYGRVISKIYPNEIENDKIVTCDLSGKVKSPGVYYIQVSGSKSNLMRSFIVQ